MVRVKKKWEIRLNLSQYFVEVVSDVSRPWVELDKQAKTFWPRFWERLELSEKIGFIGFGKTSWRKPPIGFDEILAFGLNAEMFIWRGIFDKIIILHFRGFWVVWEEIYL